jgi:hypothetical protein
MTPYDTYQAATYYNPDKTWDVLTAVAMKRTAFWVAMAYTCSSDIA